MIILGIASGYHDSAAAIIRNGEVVACVQEERFSRIKGDNQFPISAINYCCQVAGVLPSNVDAVAFYEKPYSKFHRSLRSQIETFPYSYPHFMSSIKSWLGERLSIDLKIQDELSFNSAPYFVPHHLAHAASSTFVSPFDEAAFIVSDGVGEWATLSYGTYVDNKLKTLEELHFPNSVGLIYSAITFYLGFNANGGEGKVMGLADYGQAIYLDDLLKTIDLKEDGSFKLDESYWDFKSGRIPVTKKFIKKFGDPRIKGSELKENHFNMASSLQKLTELILIRVANHVYEKTKLDSLCLSGGSFLNIPTNSKILESTPFKNLYIQPSASDAGAALGAALYVNNLINPNSKKYFMNRADFGPEYSDAEIERQLLKNKFKYNKLEEEEVIALASNWINENEVIIWFQGRIEFGPRALGHRSILASARNKEMKDYLNLEVKKRESFRPYGISILEEKENEILISSKPSGKSDFVGPFMLKLGQVRNDFLNVYPSAVHVDGSTRYQTVTSKDGIYYKLIKKLNDDFNMPLIINTSFNLDGEPIVNSPEDACKTFKNSLIKKMVIGNYVVEKN